MSLSRYTVSFFVLSPRNYAVFERLDEITLAFTIASFLLLSKCCVRTDSNLSSGFKGLSILLSLHISNEHTVATATSTIVGKRYVCQWTV